MTNKTAPENRHAEADEIARLNQENKLLSEQVKRLIRVETRLYEYQEELDSQLKEYQRLYELNRKFATDFNIQKVFEHAIGYIIQDLEYERIVFLRRPDNSEVFTVCAIDGYYDPEIRKAVSGLVLEQNDPFLAPLLLEGREYLICKEDSEKNRLTGFRNKLFMNEYLIYPLGSHTNKSALMIVGNSAENAVLHRRIDDSKGALLGTGNLAGILSSSVENNVSYTSMEKALNQEKIAEAKYRSIFENAIEGIFRTTPDGRIIDANPSIAAILGHEIEDAFKDAASVKDLYEDQSRRDELLQQLSINNAVTDFEVRLRSKDGQTIWASLNVRAVKDSGGKIVYLEGFMTDISKRKQAEAELLEAREELLRKEKLAILGQLSGSVGHELRNPLGVMNNAIYLLRIVLADADSKTKEYLDIIKQEIDNSLRIITDLLDFARTKPPRKNTVNIRELIEASLKKCSIPEHVAIRIDMPEKLPVLWTDQLQMEQVLQNLITNGIQAMPEKGGMVTIRTEQMLEEGILRICVIDNGRGITAKNMKKLFQPLFTTKTKGIGLGLVVCKNLVEANGGRIEVQSEPDKGTTFCLLLPLESETV